MGEGGTGLGGGSPGFLVLGIPVILVIGLTLPWSQVPSHKIIVLGFVALLILTILYFLLFNRFKCQFLNLQ